jgi:putative glutamine amidotransferase
MAAKVGVTDCGDPKILPYEDAIQSVGLEPVRLSANSGQTLDGLCGLVLTGGVDVNPKWYGETPHDETQDPDDERDEFEFALVAEALATDLPLFAICRGMQLLNVHLHGTLTQHLSSTAIHQQRFADDAPGAHRSVHTIRVLPGTLLAQIVGAGTHEINSRHHQAVDHVAPGATVSAVSSDGVIEAMELPSKRFALAVQWHPEDRIHVSETDVKLFQAFAAVVSGADRFASSRST